MMKKLIKILKNKSFTKKQKLFNRLFVC